MLRCYFAALSKNTVAAAIAWPARTRCQRGHQERKRSCVARVSTVGARESTRADFLKKTSTSACSFYDSTVKNILGCSTRNDKFKRCFYDSTIKYTWLQYKKRQIQALFLRQYSTNILGYSTRNDKFKRCSFYHNCSTVKIYLATVQDTTNSSAWNHIFIFRRRGRGARRSRKLLPLCHTRGSAPRSPYLPYQIMDSWKNSELQAGSD